MRKTFSQGVHPKEMKHLTEDKPIEEMPLVSDYFISLSQHIGASASPAVQKGDRVAEGQLIGQASGKVSANIFSSVSGVVEDILPGKNAQGSTVSYVHIKAQGDEKTFLPAMGQISGETIRARIREAGIVGMGGAGFPTDIKCSPSKPADILLINASECEPYLNSDYRLIMEHAKEAADGIKLLAEAVGVKKIMIGIEDNKMPAYEKLLAEGFDAVLLKKKYPQGAEKMLIRACTGWVVPKGGLPMDAGVAVNNVGTAYAVYDAVRNNAPLYKRVVTVSGGGVANPKNLWVRVGTPHEKIFEFCGGYTDKAVKFISGGPMMGFPLSETEHFSTKTEGGLLALTLEEINTMEESNCIHCGRCAKVCPMKLMPMYIDFHMLSGDLDNAVKYGAVDCIECGACSFICPAKRWLVQSIRMAKQKLKEKKAK